MPTGSSLAVLEMNANISGNDLPISPSAKHLGVGIPLRPKVKIHLWWVL